MVRKRTNLGKKLPDSVPVYDINTKKVVSLGRGEVEDQIDKLYQKMLQVLSRVEKLGNYQLAEIEISIGFAAGVFVVTLEGGVVLRYTLSGTPPP
jgi:hypothetical protein